MFEGLIEFIEETLFGLINKITTEEKSGFKQLESVTAMLLGFAQKNRGMTRVLIGDALVHENERLQQRINQLHDRVEATLKQALRFAAGQNEIAPLADPSAQAQSDHELCHRTLASVREERLQARPDAILERAMERAACGLSAAIAAN